MINFTLTKEQYQKYLDWRETLPVYPYADTAHYGFTFIPVGVSYTITVSRSDGHMVNLS